MSDDLSQLDATIDAEFREVGWRASGPRATVSGDVTQPGNAASPADLRRLIQAVDALTERFGESSSKSLESIDNRLGIVTAVLNRPTSVGSPHANGTASSTHGPIEAEVAELKARVESLTTVFIEFGTSIRRAVSTNTSEVSTALSELGRRLDGLEAVLDRRRAVAPRTGDRPVNLAARSGPRASANPQE